MTQGVRKEPDMANYENKMAILSENEVKIPFTIKVKTTEKHGASWYKHYEDIKDKVVIEICSSEKKLEGIPHYRFCEDIFAYFKVIIGEVTPDAIAAFIVKPQHLKEWGVTEKQLYKDAVKATQALRPLKLRSMTDIFREHFGFLPIELNHPVPLWVASNPNTTYGATVMAYPNFIDEVKHNIGKNCYILPSSIHELVIQPDIAGMPDINFLKQMVQCINVTSVKPEDRLSDNVFYLDINKKTITLVS